MAYEFENIKDYVTVVHPSLIKDNWWAYVFLAILFGAPITFTPPITLIMSGTISLFIIITIFWGLYIRLDVEKRQKEYVLFLGVTSLFISVTLLIGFYKIMYQELNIMTPIPIILVVIVFLLIAVIGMGLQIKALNNTIHVNKKNGTIGLIVGFSVIGIYISKFLIQTLNQQIILTILAFICLFLAFVIELGAHNIYKYYLIKQYEQNVKLYTLPKKKMRK